MQSRLFLRFLVVLTFLSELACHRNSGRPDIDESDEQAARAETAKDPTLDLPSLVTRKTFPLNVRVFFPEGSELGERERVLTIVCSPAVSLLDQNNRKLDLLNREVEFNVTVETFSSDISCSKIVIADEKDSFFESTFAKRIELDQGDQSVRYMEPIQLEPNAVIAAEIAMKIEAEELEKARLEAEAAHAKAIEEELEAQRVKLDQAEQQRILWEEQAIKMTQERIRLEQIRIAQEEELKKKDEMLEEAKDELKQKEEEIDKLKDELENEKKKEEEKKQGNISARLQDNQPRMTFFLRCDEGEIFDVTSGSCRQKDQ